MTYEARTASGTASPGQRPGTYHHQNHWNPLEGAGGFDPAAPEQLNKDNWI
jgi:hypothetical protein